VYPHNHVWFETAEGYVWSSDAQPVRNAPNVVQASLPADADPTLVLGSHDERRLATRLGEAQTRVAAMLLLTLRGAPVIYYGDEIGMVDGRIPPHLQRDPWPKSSGLPQHSRDPARTPMQWEAGPGAGFTPVETNSGAVITWLPIHSDHRQVNVRAQQQEPRSLLNLYRKLLRLRRSSAALRAGSYRPAYEAPRDTYVYYRTLGEQSFLVALNFGADDLGLTLADQRPGRVLISSWLDREEQVLLGNFHLRAHEGIIVQLEPEAG